MRKYLIPAILLVVGTVGPTGGAVLGSYLATPHYAGCGAGQPDGSLWTVGRTLYRCDSGVEDVVGVATQPLGTAGK
jgi:hypothetical protein